MSKYPPYIQRNAGDVVTSDDWNRLQELIREEVRQHRHEGETGDTNRLGVLGTQLDNASLAEGAVDEPAFAEGAVTADALQERSLADWAVAEDAAIAEKDHLLFDPEIGHDHDGEGSSALARASVGTEQLADDAVTYDKLEPALLDELVELEQLIAIPQALSVGEAAGSSGGVNSYVDIVGHGFGRVQGDSKVYLLKTTTESPGEYRRVQELTVEDPAQDWTTNRIRVLLPEDPTGLFEVEVAGLPLNPLRFDESLAVTDVVPDHLKLDVEVDSQFELTFSTELLVVDTSGGSDQEFQLMALYPGESIPRALEQDLDADGPLRDLPIEIYYGEDVTRLDAALSLSTDRKRVTLTHTLGQLPWDTPFVIRVYGEDDRDDRPVLVAANNQEPMNGTAIETRFTTQKEPPPEPVSIRIVEVVGKGDKVISPANVISRTNQHAAPIAIVTDEETLPSDWLAVEVTDGIKTLSERLPAIGGGETVYVTIDTRALEDGPIQVMAQARNTTSGSDWTEIVGIDPRTREAVSWVPKDTVAPFVLVHPVRTPTKIDTQIIEIDVEPGSTVTVLGGARTVVMRDAAFVGSLKIAVPLNPNTTNNLRVSAVDAVGNRSPVIAVDREGTALSIVHDDTLPELKVEPVRSPTRSRRIRLKGTSNEQVTVVATSGGRIATSTADLNQPFSIPFDLRPNSLNRIRLVATDLAGNTSPPATLLVRHDDQPPPLRLVNKGYHRFSRVSSSNPRIVVRRTRVAIGGYTEPGSLVTLTGHGQRVRTRAKHNGSFTIGLPFRLTPRNWHNRVENRTWTFDLDAVDLSGNRTNQRRRLTVVLEYRIPGHIQQYWRWWWHWWYWWWWRWSWNLNGRWWFYDAANRRYVWYYVRYRYYRYWYNFGWWIQWV